MTFKSRRQTGAADAALILSDLKKRVDSLEKERSPQEDEVQIFRNADETVFIDDSVEIRVGEPGGFTFGVSQWGIEHFGDVL